MSIVFPFELLTTVFKKRFTANIKLFLRAPLQSDHDLAIVLCAYGRALPGELRRVLAEAQ